MTHKRTYVPPINEYVQQFSNRDLNGPVGALVEPLLRAPSESSDVNKPSDWVYTLDSKLRGVQDTGFSIATYDQNKRQIFDNKTGYVAEIIQRKKYSLNHNGLKSSFDSTQEAYYALMDNLIGNHRIALTKTPMAQYTSFEDKVFEVQLPYEISPISYFPSEDAGCSPGFYVYTTADVNGAKKTSYSLIRNPRLTHETSPKKDRTIWSRDIVAHNGTGKEIGQLLSFIGRWNDGFLYKGKIVTGFRTGTAALGALMGKIAEEKN
jgi:hypothetical protein